MLPNQIFFALFIRNNQQIYFFSFKQLNIYFFPSHDRNMIEKNLKKIYSWKAEFPLHWAFWITIIYFSFQNEVIFYAIKKRFSFVIDFLCILIFSFFMTVLRLDVFEKKNNANYIQGGYFLILFHRDFCVLDHLMTKCSC